MPYQLASAATNSRAQQSAGKISRYWDNLPLALLPLHQPELQERGAGKRQVLALAFPVNPCSTWD